MSFNVVKDNLNSIPEASQGTSKGLLPGGNLVTINVGGITVGKTKTGKTVANINVESKPIENFEGFDRPDGTKASGKVATVSLGAYVEGDDFESDSKNVNRIVNNIRLIAAACGVADKVDALKVNSMQEFFDKSAALINGKYFWVVLNGYINNKGYWTAGSMNEYPVNKGKGDEKRYVQVCPENAMKSIVTGEKDTIVEIKYTNREGKESKMTWDSNNKWCLNRDKAPSITTPDEELGSDTSTVPVF